MKLINVKAIAGVAHSTGDELDAPTTDEVTVATYVNVECIRSFAPRKDGRTGTRIVFANGVGMPVLDTMDEVYALVSAA